jgi:hypothetical protein
MSKWFRRDCVTRNSLLAAAFSSHEATQKGIDMTDERRRQAQALPDTPTIEEQDWDAIETGQIVPESVPDNGDESFPDETIQKPGDQPEEDDDNPYQESDEALPDDAEEAALTRDQSKEGSRFDEV